MNENSSIYVILMAALIVGIFSAGDFIFQIMKEMLEKSDKEDHPFLTIYPLFAGPALIGISVFLSLHKFILISLVISTVFFLIYMVWDRK